MSNREKVFGLTYPHVGSRSLALAMKQLGYRVGAGTMGSSGRYYDNYMRCMLRGSAKFTICKDFDYVGGTGTLCYRQLSELWPSAKFILCFRDPKQWIERVTHHHSRPIQKTFIKRALEFPIDGRGASRLAYFGSIGFNRDEWLRRYLAHAEDVRKFFRGTDRLLVLNVCSGEGWGKVCPFLGVPEPDMPFPAINKGHMKRRLKDK